MYFRIFLKQLKRGRKRTLLYVILLAMATAFFVMSMNLYQNSINNLEVSESTFSTLAVTELHGDVDKYGNLVEENSKEHIGYKALGVKGYDFSQIIDSEAVKCWDLRTNYGAYIEGEMAMLYGPGTDGRQNEVDNWYLRSNNIIRFKLKADEPMELTYYPMTPGDAFYFRKGGFFALEVLDEASGCLEYPNTLEYDNFGFTNQEDWDAQAENIKKFNQSDVTDKLILYPDVEYVAILRNHGDWLWNEEKGLYEDNESVVSSAKNFRFVVPMQDYESIHTLYDDSKEVTEYIKGETPFPLQRWEDVQNDPQLKAYFEDLWQKISVQHYVHNVVTTNDVTSIPAFHLGGAELIKGRFITEEEYASGAKVCLISKDVAQGQGWKVGDVINMKLFESDYVRDRRWVWESDQPIYKGESTPFVYEDEYKIVGVYDIYPLSGYTELAVNTLDMLEWNIYIPSNSVPVARDLSDVLVHGATFSIKLHNGSVEQFKADMEAKGLLNKQEGQYTPVFHFYDQGYSAVKSSLLSMNSTAKLLLLLSTVLLLIVCILLAYFFWQNQRHSVGIFRMLGGKKKQALTAVLACAMILTMIGAVIGAVAGYSTAYVVGTGIIKANVKEIEMDMSQENDLSALTDQQSDIRIAADPAVTLAASGVSLLYPLFLLGFMAADINKEPRELLPKSKA